MSCTTTSYGTWCNHGDSSALTVEQTVHETLGDYAADFDCEALSSAYRDAINDALPDGVSLCGDEFYGPYYPDDCSWEGELDLAEVIAGVDLWALIPGHEAKNGSRS